MKRRPFTAEEIARRLLLWIVYMLVIIVGIPLYFLSQTNDPWIDRAWTILLVVMAPIMIIVYFVRRRQRRMQCLRQHHICVGCGYDLRATPTRCPECGRTVEIP